MKKLLNIGYWVFTIALCICGVFFLALTYVPAEYIAPVLEQMHISYEWCIGLSTGSFAAACIFVVTRLGYSVVIQRLKSQALQASIAVKENNDKMQLIEQLFTQCISGQNEINNRLKQLELNGAAMLDMEKETARARLSGSLMTQTNRAELQKALTSVMEKEQKIAELKATAVVYEQVVEKVVEPEETPQNANDGLI